VLKSCFNVENIQILTTWHSNSNILSSRTVSDERKNVISLIESVTTYWSRWKRDIDSMSSEIKVVICEFKIFEALANFHAFIIRK
jgi:hypothetical protein